MRLWCARLPSASARAFLPQPSTSTVPQIDVVTATPCAIIAHNGVLCGSGLTLAALSPTCFVKAEQLTQDGRSYQDPDIRWDHDLHGDLKLLVYCVSPGVGLLSSLRLTLTQTCSLAAKQRCWPHCYVAGSRLLVSCANVLTVWQIDPSRTRISLEKQLVAPGFCDLDRPLPTPGSAAPGLFNGQGLLGNSALVECTIWAIAVLDDDTVAVCHGDGGQEAPEEARHVRIWHLAAGQCIAALALTDVEACVPIAAPTLSGALGRPVGWPAPNPDLTDPPQSQPLAGCQAGLFMYEDAGGSTFELGIWDGRSGRFHRSGCTFCDVIRDVAALTGDLVVVGGDGGHLKLFSVAECAFVPWPGDNAALNDVYCVDAMAGGSALVTASEPAVRLSTEVRGPGESLSVLLWLR